MNRYFSHLHSKPTHHKRRISMQASALITAAVALVWISTLGVRLSGTIGSGAIAGSDASGLVAGVAAAGEQLQFPQVPGSVQSAGSQISAADTGAASTSDPAVVLGSPDTSASSDSSSDGSGNSQ